MATVETQTLERRDGQALIRFQLENPNAIPVFYHSYQVSFVAGTYESHPSGDQRTIEGNDRYISIWFYPAENREKAADGGEIPAGGKKSFTAGVTVPADMPNPVKVSPGCQGRFVEACFGLGPDQMLKWIETTGANFP